MRLPLFLAIVATLAAGLSESACAADWYTGAPGDGPPEAKPPRATLDISIDASTQSAISGALIGTIAPFAPMDRSGMRIRVGGIAGSYVYTSGTPFVGQVNGTIVGGSMMFGYEWVTRRVTGGVYMGLEGRNTSISPNDPTNTVKGGRVGLKIAGDFYATPTEDTMIAGVASYSSNFNSYYGRLKFGFAVADRVYVGPEAAALGDNFFQQWRIGAHVSGVRLGMLQFGVAVGFLHDRVRGGGGYATLDTRVTF